MQRGECYYVSSDYLWLFNENIGVRRLDRWPDSDALICAMAVDEPTHVESYSRICALADTLARACRHSPVAMVVIDVDTAIELFLRELLTPEHFEQALEDPFGQWIDVPNMAIAGRIVTLRISRSATTSVEVRTSETVDV